MPNSTGRVVQRGFQPSLDLLDWVSPYNLLQSAQATGEVQDWVTEIAQILQVNNNGISPCVTGSPGTRIRTEDLHSRL